MNNRFYNPWSNVKGFIDLGASQIVKGNIMSCIVFLKLSRQPSVQGSGKMEIIFLEV